jgi:DNA-directed RNA polymerase sigma subunit (sigma70/sigma32)
MNKDDRQTKKRDPKKRPSKRGRKPVQLSITPELKSQIMHFRARLEEMVSYPDETSEFDVETVRIILNELDDADRNIILAYYGVVNNSPTTLARLLGTTSQTIISRVRRITTQIKKLNNANKTPYNLPRDSDYR